jgi:hypothetical protein
VGHCAGVLLNEYKRHAFTLLHREKVKIIQECEEIKNYAFDRKCDISESCVRG